jgi:Spy/CpxP family protein refolding chaperone
VTKMLNIMKKSTLAPFALGLITLLGCAVAAQETRSGDNPPMEANRPHDIRANLHQSLGLSTEQIQQIRQINVDRRPLMEAAQKQLRLANRSLDTAIYADQINEMEIEARLKDVQAAQEELSRVQYSNELSVRRILTPEQLARFRELRQRFEDNRRTFRNHRTMDANRPMRRRPPAEGNTDRLTVAKPDSSRPEH